MNTAKYFFTALLLVLFLALSLLWNTGSKTTKKSLNLYCAAALKKPVEAVVKDYEKEFGTRVYINYGGSGTLLSNILVSKRGDLFLAADDSYIQIAQEKAIITQTLPVNELRAGLAVQKDFPVKIISVKELLSRPDIKIGLANPDTASIGKLTKEVLTKFSLWSKIESHVKRNGVFTGTVNELANNLKLGTVDAGIIWDSVADQYPELQFINVPEFTSFPQKSTIGILKFSQDPVGSLHFARYLSAKDKGLQHFKKLGYKVIETHSFKD